MVLYLLPFAIYPIKDIYAHNNEEILEWLKLFDQEKIEVLAQKGRNKPGEAEDIVQVEKGELLFDFGGIVLGNEFADLELTPDFSAKIRFESIPSFRTYQSQLLEKKVGSLYTVPTYNGALASSCYVPMDIFQALKRADISFHEERVKKHIEKLNTALSNNPYFSFLPKPTKYKDFN